MAVDLKKPQQPAQTVTSHWVVLHNQVGRFEKGRVVPRIEWPEGTSFEDLQRLGAIRPAESTEVAEGYAELDPDATREARQQNEAVLKTQIDLLEKELAYQKDENQKIRLQNPGTPGNVEPSEGVKNLIKKKDASIGELTERLNSTEAARSALAAEVSQLRQALEEVTKPKTGNSNQQGEKK